MKYRTRYVWLFYLLWFLAAGLLTLSVYWCTRHHACSWYGLLISWLLVVIIMGVASRLLIIRLLRPVSEMTEKANRISAKSLHLRIYEGESRGELAELAVTFNRMLDRLEQSFDNQREFVFNIAHELRTPLAAIIGEAELALQSEKTTEDYRRVVKHMLDDAKRLSRLTTGLLDLAKASYETHQLSMKPLRFDEVLMEARSDLLHDNPTYSIRIIFDENIMEDESLTVIRGNFYLLKVALINLIDNACKFSPDADAMVKFAGDDHEKSLSVIVENSGPGILKEEIAQIFKPFFQGTASRKTGGSGIGLPLAQRIIQLHGGHIQIESEPGQLTRVKVGLPTAPSPAPPRS